MIAIISVLNPWSHVRLARTKQYTVVTSQRFSRGPPYSARSQGSKVIKFMILHDSF